MRTSVARRPRGPVDSAIHAVEEVWHAGSGLVHGLAEATVERAADAGHLVGSIAERAVSTAGDLGKTATHRAADVGDTVEDFGKAAGHRAALVATTAGDVGKAASRRAALAATTAGDVGKAAGHRAAGAVGTVEDFGRSAGHRAAVTSSGVRDSALAAVGRPRRSRRQIFTLRRIVIAAGVAVTLGVLVLVARKARTPWAEQANAELAADDPRREASAKPLRRYAGAT